MQTLNESVFLVLPKLVNARVALSVLNTALQGLIKNLIIYFVMY